MKLQFFGVLALSCVVLTATGAEAQSGDTNYPLSPAGSTAACGATVFQEHFDGASLSSAWAPLTNTTEGGGQLEAFEPSAVSVGSNGLALTATKGGPSPALYTSGRVQTVKTFLYGCFFVTAKLPAGNGLWPAIWLRTPYPINGELDLMEQRGSRPGEFQSTNHDWANEVHLNSVCATVRFASTTPWPGSGPCSSRNSIIPGSGDFSKAFHTYGLIWTPILATFLIDGQPYFSTSDYIVHLPMNIVLDLAVGGTFDLIPVDATTPFPSALLVRDVTVTALAPNP